MTEDEYTRLAGQLRDLAALEDPAAVARSETRDVCRRAAAGLDLLWRQIADLREENRLLTDENQVQGEQ